MPFVKAATVGTVSGIAVGSVFYELGAIVQGAGNLLFGINPIVMATVGFASALAIALLADQETAKK